MSNIPQDRWTTFEFAAVDVEEGVNINDLPIISNILRRRGLMSETEELSLKGLKQRLLSLNHPAIDTISALMESLLYNQEIQQGQAQIDLKEFMVTLDLYFDPTVASVEEWQEYPQFTRHQDVLRHLINSVSDGIYLIMKDRYQDIEQFKQVMKPEEA